MRNCILIVVILLTIAGLSVSQSDQGAETDQACNKKRRVVSQPHFAIKLFEGFVLHSWVITQIRLFFYNIFYCLIAPHFDVW